MHYTQPEVYEFISKQTGDPIVEWKICAVSGTKFAVFQGDLDALEKTSPVVRGKKFLFPVPNLCPEIRLLHKMCFRNERKLYKATCAYSGTPMLSMYHPDMGFTVYSIAGYLSDSWDSTSYGRELDFNENFFSQFDRLLKSTPKLSQSMSIKNLDNNSQYVNYAADLKNCYLVFDTDGNEDCYYSTNINHSSNTVDSLMTLHSEYCYECIDSNKLYKCSYVQSSISCVSSAFLYNCVNCEYCLCCTNLNTKSYHFLNEPITKEQYESILLELSTLEGMSKCKMLFDELLKKTPRPALVVSNAEGGVGNAIYDSKGIFMSHQISNCEDMRYCNSMNSANDCMDTYSFGSNAHTLYNSISVGRNSNNISLCVDNYKAKNNLYCVETRKSTNGFGCANAQHIDYSILNKQYTKGKYDETMVKVIKHMKETGERGEFFPIELSLFPYNDTIANDHFPIGVVKYSDGRQVANPKGNGVLTVLDANVVISDAELDLGGDKKLKVKWRNTESTVGLADSVHLIKPLLLPNGDRDELVKDSDVTSKIIECIVSGKPFRLTKPEVFFYKKQGLPLPMKHPDVRHQERLAKRPGKTLYIRKCDKTQKDILSVYSEDVEFPVYSVDEFQKEVYS